MSEASLKILSVITCFIMALINKKASTDKKDALLLCTGMFLTVLADYYLIIANNYILGVIIFCIVQQIYVVRYAGIKLLKVLLIAVTVVLVILNATKILLLVKTVIIYAMSLITSVISAIHGSKIKKFPRKKALIIVVGMILFLLCDINVAIYNLDLEFINKNTIHALIWICYLPSQICLAISIKK